MARGNGWNSFDGKWLEKFFYLHYLPLGGTSLAL